MRPVWRPKVDGILYAIVTPFVYMSTSMGNINGPPIFSTYFSMQCVPNNTNRGSVVRHSNMVRFACTMFTVIAQLLLSYYSVFSYHGYLLVLVLT